MLENFEVTIDEQFAALESYAQNPLALVYAGFAPDGYPNVLYIHADYRD